MSKDKAIEKINTEMQKDPTNTYLEIVGHYIIDRCGDEQVSEAVLDPKKSLSGAMSAVTSAARAKVKGICAEMKDNEIFDAIDKYFGFQFDLTARAQSIKSVDGEPSGLKEINPLPGSSSNKNSDKHIDLDFESFL